ncbi:MAG: FAD-dependent oxidoreductase [Aquabacterium sp.]
MTQPPTSVQVAIAGGGIAGMSAALRLAQRGYAVTLYEEKPWLGGNLSSYLDPKTGVYHDVFPHMFSNFYVNFWDIAEKELGLTRGDGENDDFAARDSFVMQSQRDGIKVLRNAATLDPRALWADMQSGSAGMTPLQMYLYMYSMLDLVSHRFEVRGQLGQSVNGWIRSRPCATLQVAQAHDTLIEFIWSVHSRATSAAAYRSFYRHAFGNMEPLLWLLRGSLQEKIILPLQKRLEELGVDVRTSTRVHEINLDGPRAIGLTVSETRYDERLHRPVVAGKPVPGKPFDLLILSVTPGALGRLALQGPDGNRLATRLPKLSHAGRRLQSEPIAVLDVYFKRKLHGLMAQNVSAIDSDCYFSYIDLSQLWPQLQAEGITALTLAASDYWALPGDNDKENGFHMIQELSRYVGGFHPGHRWEDPAADIDWTRTKYRSNKDDPIFVNQVGTWDYRPEVHYPDLIENVYFAGDFCRNPIDMATVEAAVSSGVRAAAAVQARAPLGETAIEVLKPPLWPLWQLAALKMMLAPAAYAAKAWLTTRDLSQKLGDGHLAENAAHDATTLMALPTTYMGDMLETAGAMWGSAVEALDPAKIIDGLSSAAAAVVKAAAAPAADASAAPEAGATG